MPHPNAAGRGADGLFLGRERELATLETSLDLALSGQGQVRMLTGEPGIGKTRCAEELANHATSRGALIVGVAA